MSMGIPNLAPVEPLNPRAISKVFGPDVPWHVDSEGRTYGVPLGGRASFRALTVSVALAIFSAVVLAMSDHIAVDGPNFYSILLTNTDRLPTVLHVEFVQDPAAVVFFLGALATPVLCGIQIECIERLTMQGQANLKWMEPPMAVNKVNAIVASSNRRFRLIGSTPVSLAVLTVAAATAAYVYKTICETGPLASWNPTTASRARWTELVQQGWWADPQNKAGACILLLTGTFFVYFLVKQLLMGVVFASFSLKALRAGFSPGPNPVVNVDGFYGLLVLRRFMLVTYVSTTAHFTLALFVLTVWLPLSVSTLAISSAVVMANVVTVVYPTLTAHSALLDIRRRYVQQLTNEAGVAPADLRLNDDLSQVIERVWSSPTLPFKFRNSVTALGIYLLAPAVLAVVSTLLPDK